MDFRLTTAGRMAAATRAARAVLGSGDGAVQVTARTVGPDGNAIAVALVDPGAASQSLSVAVAGTAITVTLATDTASAVTTTADELVAALSGDTEAGALVVAALADGSDGTGVVAAAAATALAGGGPPNLRLTRIAIGSGRGPGGAADDGRIALRAERDSAAVAGQTSARSASAVLGGEDNAAVMITAAASGSDGNAITVALVDPGAASQSLSVAVAGTAITVTLATDTASAVTTTADELVAALSGDTEAGALVVAALADGSDGTGVVAAAAATALAGGRAGTLVAVRASVGPTAVYDVIEAGLFATDGAGAELLFAFWAGEAVASTRPGVAVIVATVVDGRALDATVTCASDPDTTFDARPAFVDLADTPASYAGHALDFLRAAPSGRVEFSPAAAVAAWLHALPAVRVHAVARRSIRLVGPDSPCRWLVVVAGGGGSAHYGDYPYPSRPAPYYAGFPEVISGAPSTLTRGGAVVVRAAGGAATQQAAGVTWNPPGSIGDVVIPGSGAAGGKGWTDGPSGDLVISLLTPEPGQSYVLSAGRGGHGGERGGWPGRQGSALILEFRR